ncbi:MAG TPA: DUF6402 family protein [Alphaproteobacteria bacterium]|nr:DUF6402 family protein [Alphaproteobacteria bacterium]
MPSRTQGKLRPRHHRPPWFRLVGKNNGYRDYLTSPADPCNVEHIPWIMRANGWREGAKLMDEWFTRKASTVKKPEDSDTTTITMDWVLELEEARTAYNELMDESRWTVPNDGQGRTPLQRLCGSLHKKGFLTDHPMEFTFDTPVWNLKGRQFDNRVIRGQKIPIIGIPTNIFIHDKWGAALGAFELLLVAAGEAEPLPDGMTHRITLRKKGVFMEDQYDFEEGQSLGYWDIENHKAGHNPFSSGCGNILPVTNDSFQKWRNQNNLGGDYLIYAQVKQEDIDPPIVFYCPSGTVQI